MFEIQKDFEFSYGHRVWNQSLDANLSNSSPCKCRHLHGHTGKITVHLCGQALTNGMVTDFNHLNWFKTLIDTELDHHFIIDMNDPLFERIVGKSIGVVEIVDLPGFYHFVNSNNDDLLEGFVVVDFVPTSEKLAEKLFEVVNSKMRGIVSQVDFWETSKSCATYRVH